MTIAHDEKIGFQLPEHLLLKALTSIPTTAFRRFRHWHLDAVHTRTTAKLPAHLKYDIGEIDQIPIPTFMQNEPSSYQDRLQQMWLR
ncbi:hypothetical protein [Mesorhizobium sp. 131-2-1]|uniref:hypothetical protein n=1 Tax=Mesorhizobium sp. 131-2-1 TaxID=2744518 RepID=UPI0019287262|nr:hypothetical protein [Mesorhizobium sp. 131-2-1]BCG96914.1 hypothetical protein MesoLj131a_57780 [Mesorhizobium sp. 131-2-1]